MTILGKHPVDLRKYQIISIASLLKLFLLELPEPLLTFELYDSFLKALGNISSLRSSSILEVSNLSVPEMYTKIFCIKNVVNMLPGFLMDLADTYFPVGNRKVLSSLINLLKEIAKKSSVNLMTSNNLSVVFAASLLRSREPKSFQEVKFLHIKV